MDVVAGIVFEEEIVAAEVDPSGLVTDLVFLRGALVSAGGSTSELLDREPGMLLFDVS